MLLLATTCSYYFNHHKVKAAIANPYSFWQLLKTSVAHYVIQDDITRINAIAITFGAGILISNQLVPCAC